MSKINLLSFISLFIFFGCANTYKLEKKSSLSFKESYYTLFSSAVKDGDSGYNIYLVLNDSINLEEDEINLKGVYFKDGYSDLKKQENNLYQAFITVKGSGITSEKDYSTAKKEKNKVPFSLKENEAVISYKEKGKQRYFKIVLKNKKTIDIPM